MRMCALLLCLLCGCFGGTQDDPFKPDTATLDVRLTSPAGIVAKATLHGPASFAKVLTASATLNGLVPGSYFFEVPSLVQPTSVIDTVYSADVAPLTLAAGQSVAVAVTYGQRPGSGKIWLTGFGDARLLGGWRPEGLLAGTAGPADAQVLSSWQSVLGAQLDPAGNLWLLASDAGTESFVVFSWKDLVPGESTPKPRAIQSGERLASFTFDGAGGVWCATLNGYLVHYSSAQLTAGDLTAADIVIHGAAGSLHQPSSVAMDAVGDLWVADANSLNRYSPRQLASSGYALPATKLSVASPASLSFDAQGGAWISTGNALQRFDPAQLGKDGAPTPAASYAFGAATIHAFAFDAVGELWITCSEASRTKLIMLSPAQLAAAGPPTPFVALQTAPGSAAPSLLLVDPSPAGFPLYGVPR